MCVQNLYICTQHMCIQKYMRTNAYILCNCAEIRREAFFKEKKINPFAIKVSTET